MRRELAGAAAGGKHMCVGDHVILGGIHHTGKGAEAVERVIRRAGDRDEQVYTDTWEECGRRSLVCGETWRGRRRIRRATIIFEDGRGNARWGTQCGPKSTYRF